MIRRALFWWIGLLLGFATHGQAEASTTHNKQHTVTGQKLAQRKAAKQTGKRKLTRKKIGKKVRSKSKVARNLLYPFTLRLLYSPNYRFLDKEFREQLGAGTAEGKKVKITQIFPIATGLEAEVAFNNWVSLAVGGNFSWHGNFGFSYSDALRDEGIDTKSSYHGIIIESSLYANVNGYFKVGPGVGLALNRQTVNASRTADDGKKQSILQTASWKRMSAHLSLRRDFLLGHGIGLGLGFNAIMHLADMFDLQAKTEQCVDGSDCETYTEKPEEDEDVSGLYSVVLMPVIYIAF